MGPTPAPPKTVLRRTEAFRAVYRRGIWLRGTTLSLGMLATRTGTARIGLRTRRGLKGAVVRNRLKRQLRVVLFGRDLPVRGGLDLVVVVHPKRLPARSRELEQELRALCKRARILA